MASFGHTYNMKCICQGYIRGCEAVERTHAQVHFTKSGQDIRGKGLAAFPQKKWDPKNACKHLSNFYCMQSWAAWKGKIPAHNSVHVNFKKAASISSTYPDVPLLLLKLQNALAKQLELRVTGLQAKI